MRPVKARSCYSLISNDSETCSLGMQNMLLKTCYIFLVKNLIFQETIDIIILVLVPKYFVPSTK